MKFLNRWWDNTRRKPGSCWSSAFAAWAKPFRRNSWAARRAHWGRRTKTRRLWAQMAWIMEMITGERETERGAFRSPRGAVCLLFLDNSHPSKMLVQISGPAPSPHSCTATQTSHLWYSGGLALSTGPDEMGFRRPPCAACSNKQARCVDLWMRRRVGRDVGRTCSTRRRRRRSEAWGNGSEFGSN